MPEDEGQKKSSDDAMLFELKLEGFLGPQYTLPQPYIQAIYEHCKPLFVTKETPATEKQARLEQRRQLALILNPHIQVTPDEVQSLPPQIQPTIRQLLIAQNRFGAFYKDYKSAANPEKAQKVKILTDFINRIHGTTDLTTFNAVKAEIAQSVEYKILQKKSNPFGGVTDSIKTFERACQDKQLSLQARGPQ